jgi:hypothetical protein
MGNCRLPTLLFVLLSIHSHAEVLQKGIENVYLTCIPDRCEDDRYDMLTKSSKKSDCMSTAGVDEFWFPSRNGLHSRTHGEASAGRPVVQMDFDVTDAIVSRTSTTVMGKLRIVGTIRVNRINGRYNAASQTYSSSNISREIRSGNCLSDDGVAKRKF